MIKVPVKFETVTPLFTGGVDGPKGIMKEIKPAGIMGSLRSWFDVVCYYSGMFTSKNLKDDLNHDEYVKFIKKNANCEDKDEYKKLQLHPTAYYFGCTGWKSKIGIHSIGMNGSIKQLKGDNIIKLQSNSKESRWYLPREYYTGEFIVNFTVSDKCLKKSLLYPLLTFIERYGFMGGKNNLSFGRINLVKPSNDEQQQIKIDDNIRFDIFGKEIEVKDTIVIKRCGKDDSNLIKPDDKVIRIANIPPSNKNPDDINIPMIKQLLRAKKELRSKMNSRNLRHKIFGTAGHGDKPSQATKIIPFIEKNEDKYTGSLISYAAIIFMDT